MPDQTITIELTDKEVVLFKEFCKHYGEFKEMYRARMFSFTNGKKCVHRDENGKLRRITTEKVDFKC